MFAGTVSIQLVQRESVRIAHPSAWWMVWCVCAWLLGMKDLGPVSFGGLVGIRERHPGSCSKELEKL